MRFIFFFLLLLLGLTHPTPIEVGSSRVSNSFIFEQMGDGQDRCCNSGCMVRIRPGQGELVARVKNESHALSVYFLENSAVLSTDSIEKIKTFVTGSPTPPELSIVGYTDGCGTWSHNKDLSIRRAVAVKKQVAKIKPGLKVTVQGAGEVSHGHSARNRKVHLTNSRNIVLYEPPPKIKADFYLLDASGSMQGTKFEVYRRAIIYHRPAGSQVYIATTKCVTTMKSFSSVSPNGGTEIWYAYWSILDKMLPGQTLVVISDFDSKYPLTSREKSMIQEKVRQKRVTVRAISI